MRIFIEGSCLLKERSGIGQFIMRLVETYSEKYPEDEIIITGFKFFTQGKPDYPIKTSANLKYRIVRWFPGRIYNQLFKIGIAPPYDLLFRAKPKDLFIEVRNKLEKIFTVIDYRVLDPFEIDHCMIIVKKK